MKRNNIILLVLLSVFAFFIVDMAKAVKSVFVAKEHSEQHLEHKDSTEIELSDAAIKKYGIKSTQIAADKNVRLPISCMVKSKDEYFVYTRQGNHFQECEIHPISIDSEFVIFKPENLNSEFITDGAEYLRIVFASANGPEVGHVH